MSDIAISALPVASSAATSDVLPIVQGGITKQITNALMFTNSTLVTPSLGTPSVGTLTNCTGLPVSSGISGLGTGVATFLSTPSSANLAAAVTGETGSGALVFATSPTLVSPALGTVASGNISACTSTNMVMVTPVIGAATGTSLTATGTILSTGTAGIGYGTGAGGAVTQGTSRTTGVTLNKISGSITLFSAAGSATAATFTVTNSTVADTDVIILSQKSGTDLYNLMVTAVAAGSFNISFRTTGGTTTETPVFNFVVFKAVSA
jgi:hypothetical protein